MVVEEKGASETLVDFEESITEAPVLDVEEDVVIIFFNFSDGKVVLLLLMSV